MVVTKTTKVQKKKTCNVCAVSKRIGDEFYKVAQDDPNFPDGTLNVCKTCMRETWEDEHSGFANFVDYLRLANIPYKKNIYSSSKDKPSYIRIIRSKAYTDLRFKDSDGFVEQKANMQIKASQLEELTEEQVRECELFWGEGYDEKEYLFLMNEYAEYDQEYDLSGKAIKSLVAQMCHINLRIRKGMERDEDVSKDTKTFQDLMRSANLQPAQEKAAAENEANTFGTFIKKIENEMPIAAPLPEYQDPDGIIKLIKVFFAGAMAESMGEPNPYPEEYKEVMREYTLNYGETEEPDR